VGYPEDRDEAERRLTGEVTADEAASADDGEEANPTPE
jgi:hypothetical protein